MTAADALATALRRLDPGTLDGVIGGAWRQAEHARLRADPNRDLADVWASLAMVAVDAREDQRAALRAADDAMRDPGGEA
jgi:hypothetical protein